MRAKGAAGIGGLPGGAMPPQFPALNLNVNVGDQMAEYARTTQDLVRGIIMQDLAPLAAQNAQWAAMFAPGMVQGVASAALIGF